MIAAGLDGRDPLILLPCREAKCKRVSPLGPNKFDSFDTRVSETIELFLLPKILAGQGGFFCFEVSFIVIVLRAFSALIPRFL